MEASQILAVLSHDPAVATWLPSGPHAKLPTQPECPSSEWIKAASGAGVGVRVHAGGGYAIGLGVGAAVGAGVDGQAGGPDASQILAVVSYDAVATLLPSTLQATLVT